MASNSNWGEFEDNKRHEDWSLSLSDLEEIILPPSPPPPLYQPSQEETASFQILPSELCRSDPIVLHTIRLLQHQRQLLQLLTRPQTFGLEINPAPPFPEDPPVKRKSAKFHYLNFLPPNETPFTTGVNKPQRLEIEGTTARLILRKAIATLCAHTGYTDTTESVLKVLTDVTHDFLTKITSVLRFNKDQMLLTGNCAFHDVVEQTLQDMRLGGMAELHNMYRDRVIMYHSRVRQRTLQLHHQYQTNLLAQAGSTVLSTSLRRDSSTTVVEPSEETSNSNSASVATVTYGNYQSVGPPVVEESSILSIKSNSSVEPDGFIQSFSVHSQVGTADDEPSPAPVQSHIYSLSR